jgi:hypothetical protein
MRRVVMSATIQVPSNTPGIAGVIDASDAELVLGYKWIAHHGKRSRTPYLKAMVGDANIYMHRLLCDVWDARCVDHRDGNGLNNRRDNLRICSTSLNNANSIRQRPTSGFKGVVKRCRRWRAYIGRTSNRVLLGSFPSPIEAALAYDEAARLRWGEFARFNFPHPGELSAFEEGGAI